MVVFDFELPSPKGKEPLEVASRRLTLCSGGATFAVRTDGNSKLPVGVKKGGVWSTLVFENLSTLKELQF